MIYFNCRQRIILGGQYMNLKIGEKIRTLRLQQKMTQEQLADRLGVSYQSISRWENGITYPDIEFLPSIANYFSVSLDFLMGQDDAEKRKSINEQIKKIHTMDENDEDELIELIRTCRREKESSEYFEDICYSLQYSLLHKNARVIDELRKSKDIFFEECDNALRRSIVLKYYANLEEETHIKALLDRYSSEEPTARDYLLKERYLFRDEFELFETVRQRYLHKQIVYLVDGDISLWRDTSKPMEVEYTIYENNVKLALLHKLCQETSEKECFIGKTADVFTEQRIYIGMRQACAYVALNKNEEAYEILEDIASLMEQLSLLPDNAELSCSAPALDKLRMTIKRIPKTEKSESFITWSYKSENIKEATEISAIYPQSIIECLEEADYARWGWLEPIRKEKRFVDIIDRLKKIVF